MTSILDRRLSALDEPRQREPLRRLRRGIEKESLRVLPNGALSQQPHPAALGSPLTHPHLTLDFSEAQIELITGVHEDAQACTDELREIHQYVYRHLGDELLWPASMPCILGDDEDIPIGHFGSSNVGHAKTVYRRGLGWRYGRLMQTISGIHYNFSLPEELWPVLASLEGSTPSREFRDDAYFALIRNFRRHAWLLLLLFGASPAVCKSFVKDRDHALECFDEGSLYLPHATSLRMGRLGYQSETQSGLHVSYNSLDDYGASLHEALTQSHPDYRRIGVKVDGEYRQLSDALLQIENEFYASIRPKRSIAKGERSIVALHERGVEYVEVRCLDLDPFLPLGIDADRMRFLDVFLCHCLLRESPPDSRIESEEIEDNQLKVVEQGRAPGLTLRRAGRDVALADWGRELLDEYRSLAELLDRAAGGDAYRRSLAAQRARLEDPSLTPSAQILEAMRAEGLPFSHLALQQGRAHKRSLQRAPLAPQRLAELDAMAQESLAAQQRIEQEERLSFDEFLAGYLTIPEFPAGS